MRAGARARAGAGARVGAGARAGAGGGTNAGCSSESLTLTMRLESQSLLFNSIGLIMLTKLCKQLRKTSTSRIRENGRRSLSVKPFS